MKNKTTKTTIIALAVIALAVSTTFARVVYCGGSWVTPPPTVVTTTTPIIGAGVQVGPVTIGATTSIPAYSYGYYNNVYCPSYSGYYWYNDAWVWGGAYGVARPPMPLWRPHHHGHHFAPPRPPVHHGGFHGGPRPGGFHHGGGFHRGGFHGGGHHRR